MLVSLMCTEHCQYERTISPPETSRVVETDQGRAAEENFSTLGRQDPRATEK